MFELNYFSLSRISVVLFFCINFSCSNTADGEENKYSKAKSIVMNGEYANQGDIKQANEFLNKLPSACEKTYAKAETDGTIIISLWCEGNGNETRGTMKIKDGIITEIK